MHSRTRWIATITAVVAGSLLAEGSTRAAAGRDISTRAIDYAQSVRLTAPVKSAANGAQNVYPVHAQVEAVASITRRLTHKRPLVIQGEQLTGTRPDRGAIERFTVAGSVSYDLEVEVIRRDVQLSPPVRAAVQDAIQQVSRESVNILRVRVDSRIIMIETDADSRAVPLHIVGADDVDDVHAPG
jgi:hypothetical protein